jgi:hypothetical protein
VKFRERHPPEGDRAFAVESENARGLEEDRRERRRALGQHSPLRDVMFD